MKSVTVSEERYEAAQKALRERHVATVKTAVDALVEALGNGETDAWQLVDKLRSELGRALIEIARLKHDLAKSNTVVRAHSTGIDVGTDLFARIVGDAFNAGVFWQSDPDERLSSRAHQVDIAIAQATATIKYSQKPSTQSAPTEERKP